MPQGSQPYRSDPASTGSTARSGSTPVRRKRRRRRKRMNPLLYMLLVVAVSAVLAGLGWTWAGDVLALNKEPHSAVITLPESIFTTREISETRTDADGETETVTRTISVPDMDHVTDLLADNGLIEYKPLFKMFCWFTGVEKKEKIIAGTYELNTDMDYNALINSMSSRSGSRKTVSVTIPEGYTIDQIFALLDEQGVATTAALERVAANHDFKYSFLQGVLPLGDYHRLEGYLFPDTYQFYMGGGEDAVIQVLNKMILRFDQQVPDALRQQAADMGYSVHDLVTIASLIEKETDGSDQTRIASVIYNRLERPSSETVGMLQIDAALVYALGRPITAADYTADTPYHTYTNKGLPPGPIASPGMVSINSALNPAQEDYYYYVLGSDGLHHFFRTHQGQLDFIAQQPTQ